MTFLENFNINSICICYFVHNITPPLNKTRSVTTHSLSIPCPTPSGSNYETKGVDHHSHSLGIWFNKIIEVILGQVEKKSSIKIRMILANWDSELDRNKT